MQQVDAQRSESPVPAVALMIVLLGAAGFVATSFLPLEQFKFGLTVTYSLYQLTGQPPGNLVAHIGGILWLFTGVLTIASISILGLRNPPYRWTSASLAAAVIVWSTYWIGTLLRTSAVAPSLAVGYWLVLFSIGVVVIGTVMVVMAARTYVRSTETNTSGPPESVAGSLPAPPSSH
jgi:hypothetical protein